MRDFSKTIRPHVAIILTSCLAALAIAAPVLAAELGPTRITFRELVKGSTFSFVDNAPKTKFAEGSPEKISAGDALIATSPLVMRGKQVGRERLACTATQTSKSFTRAHFMCAATFGLGNGTLIASVIIGASRTEGAITGGTGAYAGASGTFTVAEGKAGSTVTVSLVE